MSCGSRKTVSIRNVLDGVTTRLVRWVTGIRIRGSIRLRGGSIHRRQGGRCAHPVSPHVHRVSPHVHRDSPHVHPGFLAVVNSENTLDDLRQFFWYLQFLIGAQSEAEGWRRILLLNVLLTWPRPALLPDLDCGSKCRCDITDCTP